MKAVCSAPGKILWLGGYSILERPNVGFVTGVDKRVFVQATEVETGFCNFKIPQFSVDLAGKWENGKIVFAGTPSEQELSSVKFVKIAADVCRAYFVSLGIHFKGIELYSISDPAFGSGGSKSGLGSSAAATTAAVAAIFELHGKPVKDNLQEIHKAAQITHSLAQGKIASGFDVAASCFGGCKYVRYSKELIPMTASEQEIANAVSVKWDYEAERIELPRGFLVQIASFAGESASTTSMVKAINAWRDATPENKQEYARLFREANDANEKAIGALVRINRKSHENPRDYIDLLSHVEQDPDSDGPLKEFRIAFEKSREILKELGTKSGAGIEPDEYTKLIKASEENGAFVARLPGAGGGDAIAAICLSSTGKERLAQFWKSYSEKKLEHLDVGVSNQGVRTEREMPTFTCLVARG